MHNNLMKKTCVHCGKAFKPNHGRQKLCSNKCRKARQLEQMNGWHHSHRKRVCTRRKEWLQNNREYVLAYMRDYYLRVAKPRRQATRQERQ